MKAITAADALFALSILLSFPGYEKQERRKQGQIPQTPDSSPATTSPMNPGTK